LKNGRHEAYAQILARPAPPSLVDAWCESADGQRPEATAGRRVTASNVHARPEVLDRIAYLRRSRQTALGSQEPITEARLTRMMQECTKELVRASEAAERAGLSAAQAAQIRHKIVVHAGRASRMNGEAAPEIKPEILMSKLYWCTCSTVT
jgi:hypothetical protein